MNKDIINKNTILNKHNQYSFDSLPPQLITHLMTSPAITFNDKERFAYALEPDFADKYRSFQKNIIKSIILTKEDLEIDSSSETYNFLYELICKLDYQKKFKEAINLSHIDNIINDRNYELFEHTHYFSIQVNNKVAICTIIDKEYPVINYAQFLLHSSNKINDETEVLQFKDLYNPTIRNLMKLVFDNSSIMKIELDENNNLIVSMKKTNLNNYIEYISTKDIKKVLKLELNILMNDLTHLP
jgi:hypothetical protein